MFRQVVVYIDAEGVVYGIIDVCRAVGVADAVDGYEVGDGDADPVHGDLAGVICGQIAAITVHCIGITDQAAVDGVILRQVVIHVDRKGTGEGAIHVGGVVGVGLAVDGDHVGHVHLHATDGQYSSGVGGVGHSLVAQVVEHVSAVDLQGGVVDVGGAVGVEGAVDGDEIRNIEERAVHGDLAVADGELAGRDADL